MAGSRWKWAALAAAALLAVFLLWFFVFRSAAGSISTSTPPPAPGQPFPTTGAGKTVSYAQYTSAIDSALADVRSARDDSKNRASKVQSARLTLEGVQGAQITGAPGEPGPVVADNGAAITELRAGSPNLDALEGSLLALSESLSAQTGRAQAGTLGGEQAKAELRKVLSDQAFNYDRDLTPVQKLARWLSQFTGEADPGDTLWRWFLAFIAGFAAGAGAFVISARLENRAARLGLSAAVGFLVGGAVLAGASALGTTFTILAAVGVVLAVIAALLFGAGFYRASAPPGKPRAVSELAAVLGMGSGEALRKASDAASVGDYRLAVRFRSLAALLAMDEAGQLMFDRAATDREYLFRAPGPLHDDLQPLLDRFSAIWYGEAPATEEDWREVSERAAHLEAMSARAKEAGTTAGRQRSAA